MLQNSTQNIKLLLLKVAEGDENAFEKLFKYYSSKLKDYILIITKSSVLTEEIVQDVFLKIWLNRTFLTKIDSFKSYLFVIARNYTFDCLKQINRKKKQEKEWVNTIINHSLNELIESLTDNSHERIDTAIKLLPPQQKKIYALRIKGMKQAEIAQNLNISTETVKKHTYLATRFLKNRLKASVEN